LVKGDFWTPKGRNAITLNVEAGIPKLKVSDTPKGGESPNVPRAQK
jgi:hypothetical protein